ALTLLRVVTEAEYDQIVSLTKEISQIVKETLADKGLELFDIKLEFGRNKETKEIMLIDDISGGNMRVYDKDGTYIEPLQLETYLCEVEQDMYMNRGECNG